MLQLTKEATRHLVHLRDARGLDDHAGARFVSKGGRVGLTFTQSPSEGDRIVDADTIKVFVAQELTEVLRDSIIDAREADGKRGLVMRKQPSTGSKAN